MVDTHAALWWLTDDARLPQVAREAIAGAESPVVSAASVWEVAIKRPLGKLDAPPRFSQTLAGYGFELLAITAGHAERVADLPLHHGDPFDRLLVAQALEERLTLVSGDRALAAYGVPMVW